MGLTARREPPLLSGPVGSCLARDRLGGQRGQHRGNPSGRPVCIPRPNLQLVHSPHARRVLRAQPWLRGDLAGARCGWVTSFGDFAVGCGACCLFSAVFCFLFCVIFVRGRAPGAGCAVVSSPLATAITPLKFGLAG